MISVSRINSSTVRDRTNKRCQRSFNSLVSYFNDYCQILELFSSFGRKEFQHDTSLKSLDLMNGLLGMRERN